MQIHPTSGPSPFFPSQANFWKKLVYLQLSSHLNSNNLLFPLQSGFRPSHSTQTLLLYCLDQWYRALDKRSFVGVVFIDITKAFDTVSHNLLLSKLPSLGLSTSAVSWFRRCDMSKPEVVEHVTPRFYMFSYPFLLLQKLGEANSLQDNKLLCLLFSPLYLLCLNYCSFIHVQSTAQTAIQNRLITEFYADAYLKRCAYFCVFRLCRPAS